VVPRLMPARLCERALPRKKIAVRKLSRARQHPVEIADYAKAFG